MDASSTANGNLSNSVVGTKDLAARAPEDGSIVGGGSTGSNRKARGATTDQDFDMEIDDEKGLFSVEANITDRTAGAKEDRQIGVSSSDVYNGESREAVDNHHLDMEIDDEDNIKKVILSRDGNIAVGGICSNVSKGETRRVPDNQDLDMDIDVGARLNHGEEASMPAEEAITAESKRALATSAEDEASTSMTPSVKEPISQLSAEPSQEDKLRAEVVLLLKSYSCSLTNLESIEYIFSCSSAQTFLSYKFAHFFSYLLMNFRCSSPFPVTKTAYHQNQSLAKKWGFIRKAWPLIQFDLTQLLLLLPLSLL